MADSPLSLEDIFDQAQSQPAPPVSVPDSPASAPPVVTPPSSLGATAPPPATPPGQSPAPPRRDVLNHLHAQGMDVSGFQSDDDWFDACETHEAAIARERQALDEYYRNRDQYIAWQQQAQAPTAPQAAAPPAAPEAGKPSGPPVPTELAWEFSQKGYIAIDPKTGRYKAVDPSLAPLEKQLNDYTDWQRTQARKIVTKPDEWFEESGLAAKYKPKEINEDELFQKFEERLTQRQQKSQLENQYLQVEPLLFQTNSAGQPVRNAAGDFVPTDLGRQFKDTISLLATQGVSDQYQRLRIAMSLMAPQLTQAHQQRLAPPAQPPVAAPPQAPAPPPLTVEQQRAQRQGDWLKDTTSRTDAPLSADDAQIYEAVNAGLNQHSHKGSKRLGDLYEQAEKLALNTAR
jgi:hypothetical protein